VGGGDIVEIEGGVDYGLEDAAADEGEDVIGEGRDGGGFFGRGTTAQGGGEDAEALVEHDAEVDLCASAGGDSDADQTAKSGEGLEIGGEIGGADEVEDDIDAEAAGGLEDLIGKGFGFVPDDDGFVEAEGADSLELLLTAGGAEDEAAGGVGQLNGGGADAGRSGVNEDGLAELEIELGEEGVMGSDEDLWEGGGLDPTERVGDLGDGAFGNEDELCLSAAAGDAHHAAAGFPTQGGGAGGDDLAGEFEAGDIGRGAGRGWVKAAALENIGAVETSGVNANEDLVAAGKGRIGEIADGKNLRTPGLSDQNGAHVRRNGFRRSSASQAT